MTRDEAEKILEQTVQGEMWPKSYINAFVALGMLKVDDPVPPPARSIEEQASRVLETYGFTRTQCATIMQALYINDFRIKEREA